MNNGLRTAMDLMVRDMLQVGQGLPGGRAILLPERRHRGTDAAARSRRLELSVGWTFVLSAASDGPGHGLRGDHGRHPRARTWSGHRRRRAGDRHDHDARGRQLVRIGHLAGVCGQRPQHHRADARATVTRLCSVPRNPAMHPSGHIISDDPDVGGDNIRAGDLIMLTKGAASALVQVSSVTVGDPGDQLRGERLAEPESEPGQCSRRNGAGAARHRAERPISRARRRLVRPARRCRRRATSSRRGAPKSG